MLQLILVGIGSLIIVSGVRAFMAASPSISPEVRKAKTGVSSPGAAKVMGIVQATIGLAMFVAGMTTHLWTPR